MEPMQPMKPMKPMESLPSDWWPASLDAPASTGSQDGWRYAYFPRQRRLAVERDGQVTLYATGDHAISGARQSRSSGTGAGPVFTSQHGDVSLDSLRRVSSS
ncbi:hypothetical protein QTI45_30430 [Variovorax sp. J22R187]|nr:hypothetical protein [Variovorax sp. J22R187]